METGHAFESEDLPMVRPPHSGRHGSRMRGSSSERNGSGAGWHLSRRVCRFRVSVVVHRHERLTLQTQDRRRSRLTSFFGAGENTPVVRAYADQKTDMRRALYGAGIQTGGSVIDGLLLRMVGAAGFTPLALPWLGLWAVHTGFQRLAVQPKFRETVGAIGDKGTLALWNKTARAAQRRRPPKEDPSTDALFDDVSHVSNGWQMHVPFLAMDSLTIVGSVVGAAILGGPVLAAALGVTTATIAVKGRRSMRNARDVDRQHHEAQVELRERFRDIAHPHGWDLFRRMGATLLGRNRFHTAAGKEAGTAGAARRPRLRAGFWTAAVEIAFTAGMLAFAVATGNPLLALGPMIMATQAFGAAVRLPHNLLGVQPAVAASKRLTKFLDEPPQVVERPNARDLPRRLKRGVEVDHVTFGYDQDNPVLQDVSLTLLPGTVTALVGRNASGKSTLTQVLQRKYDVRHGSIRIDGIDLRDAKLDAVDAVTGRGVPQHDHVLTGTLRENLLLAQRAASDAELQRVCRVTGLDHWLTSMNHGRGLDVPVAQGTVSGGTRQRIALARMLLDPPAVALLDEPTSALDPNSRHTVLTDVIRELRDAGSAVLLTAHDLKVIRQADHVAVLEQGHVVEEGRPHELLQGDTALTRHFAQDPDLPEQDLWDEFDLDGLVREQQPSRQPELSL